MTVKLYNQNSYQKEFTAVVTACEPAGDNWQICLSQTTFFPEGGGQAADTGWLDEARVLDVQEKDGEVYHLTDRSLPEGLNISGRIDWDVRFERMQQHTGEHIVSGLICRTFGHRNVGFHLGDEVCTMDFNGPVSREELKDIEYRANQAVAENLPVETLYPSKEEEQNLDYRSKIEIKDQIRLINIPGIDLCACCAPHLSQTGAIGLIKLIDMQNYKGGVRITMVSGLRALRDYNQKELNAKTISAALSAPEAEIAAAVERLKEENEVLKMQLRSKQQEIITYKVDHISPSDLLCLFEPELAEAEAREMVNLLLGKGTGICAVFFAAKDDAYRYIIGSKTNDVRPIGEVLNESFAGRGGGKPEMIQGALVGSEKEVCSVLRDASERLYITT